jgi:hypothetical protein
MIRFLFSVTVIPALPHFPKMVRRVVKQSDTGGSGSDSK